MELQSVIPFWWLFEGVSIMFQSSWWLKLWKEVWSSRNNEFAIIWWPWCGLGRWSLMTRPVTVWRERIYACSLTLDSQLRYCNFYTHTHTHIYILFFLFFSSSLSSPLSFSILIPRRRWPLPVLHLFFCSLSFSFTSGQAAVAGQVSVGLGREGVEGRRGVGEGEGEVVSRRLSIAKPRAQ